MTKKMAPSIPPPSKRVAPFPAQAEGYGNQAVIGLQGLLLAFLRWVEFTGGLPPDPPARIRDFLEEMKGRM